MIQGNNSNTYSYDNNGNTISETISGGSTYYAYDYDPRNRLTAYNLEAGGSTLPIATISYDGDGLRRPKWASLNVTTYIWDGVDTLAEESGGSIGVVYATVNGQLVEENRGGTVTEYVPDTLGSVIQTTNASGTQTSSATYWPYGEINTSSGSNPSPWKFVGTYGYYMDYPRLASGPPQRYYVRARDYRPDLSRWLTVDPLWPDEASYMYVNDGPNLTFDRNGKGSSDVMGGNFGNCSVRICSLYGFAGGPGLVGTLKNIIVGQVPTHRFLCVTGPHGGCQGGLYPGKRPNSDRWTNGWAPGHVESDKWNPCGGRNSAGDLVGCKIVSTDCNLASFACECLRTAASRHPLYFFPINTCYSFPYDVVSCACDKLPPGLDIQCRFKLNSGSYEITK